MEVIVNCIVGNIETTSMSRIRTVGISDEINKN